MSSTRLPISFYTRSNTLQIAKELLGCKLCTFLDGLLTEVIIVETEAYLGVTDRASHAWGERHTKRTSVMYQSGGVAYVYFIYGMHSMFNIVVGNKGTPHAILVRAGEPYSGVEAMLERRGKTNAAFTLTKGPGSLAKALGINVLHTGQSLDSNVIWLEQGATVASEQLIATARIGVDYAGEDALLPYRFFVKGNPYVSGKASQNIEKV